jgi:hypothetical protein
MGIRKQKSRPETDCGDLRNELARRIPTARTTDSKNSSNSSSNGSKNDSKADSLRRRSAVLD